MGMILHDFLQAVKVTLNCVIFGPLFVKNYFASKMENSNTTVVTIVLQIVK